MIVLCVHQCLAQLFPYLVDAELEKRFGQSSLMIDI